jgi:hypothetical protein
MFLLRLKAHFAFNRAEPVGAPLIRVVTLRRTEEAQRQHPNEPNSNHESYPALDFQPEEYGDATK